jgi:hypothetical protein
VSTTKHVYDILPPKPVAACVLASSIAANDRDTPNCYLATRRSDMYNQD